MVYFLMLPILLLLRLLPIIFPLLMLYFVFRLLSGGFSSGFHQPRWERRYGGGQGGNASSRNTSNSSDSFNKEEGREERNRKGPSRNPYEILGCSSGDSDEKIRKSYRDLVAKYHPDRFIGMDLDADFVRLASERFSQIQEAYRQIRRFRGLS